MKQVGVFICPLKSGPPMMQLRTFDDPMEPITRPSPLHVIRSKSMFSLGPLLLSFTEMQSSWFQMLESAMCTLRPDMSQPSVLKAVKS